MDFNTFCRFLISILLILQLLIAVITFLCIKIRKKEFKYKILKHVNKLSWFSCIVVFSYTTISYIVAVTPFQEIMTGSINNNVPSWHFNLLICAISIIFPFYFEITIPRLLMPFQNSFESINFEYNKCLENLVHSGNNNITEKNISNYIIDSFDKLKINIAEINVQSLKGKFANNNEINMDSFSEYNFDNAYNYFLLNNHKKITNSALFSRIYFGIYKKVTDNFLKSINVDNNDIIVPEFISDEILINSKNIPDIIEQHNTSILDFESFYNNYKNLLHINSTSYSCNRVFICEINNKEEKLIDGSVNGLCELTSNTKIPFLLWIMEWHKINGWGIYFVDKHKVSSIATKNEYIDCLDFSLIRTKYSDLVLSINDKPEERMFYNIVLKYYNLHVMEESSGEHNKFFRDLISISDKHYITDTVKICKVNKILGDTFDYDSYLSFLKN